jgi:hypothetical protein
MSSDVRSVPVGPGTGEAGIAAGATVPPPSEGFGLRALSRWLPAAAAVVSAVTALLLADTPAQDVLRYAFYALYSVMLPGTLVFRLCRRNAHTLVEDLAYGTVVGLCLEVLAWAAFSIADLRDFVILWPLAVVVPFVAAPRLRRHWRPADYTRVPLGWAWTVAVLASLAIWYVYGVFLIENPILPRQETSSQFLDLAYQLSVAGNAKHAFPVQVPQVNGETLNYHWFAFVHMAMTSMVGHIDLPVVQMRLMIPALTALTIVTTAVTGWRIAGRAWAGPVAAALFFAIGEFGFSYPNALPFGSPEVVLMLWASYSMTYSQPLLMALIGVLGDRLGGPAAPHGPRPLGGRGTLVLAALLGFGSSVAKASSLPVTLCAVGVAALVVLIRTRRLPWQIIALGTVVVFWQLLATAVVFRFQSYGLQVKPLANFEGYWASPVRPQGEKVVLGAVAILAFLLNSQLRMAGIVPLLWRRRWRLSDREWFLLGGAVAGPAVYLVVNGWNAAYFTHAGLAFGVLLSAAGFVMVWERARMTRRAGAVLGITAVLAAAALTVGIHRYSDSVNRTVRGWFVKPTAKNADYTLILPIVTLAVILTAAAVVAAVVWRLAARRVPGLRGRGGIALVTAALMAGAPTLPLDIVYSSRETWFGYYTMPHSKIDAARWVRAHSSPTDIVATNEHCASTDDYNQPHEPCGAANSFWLSAYSERSVLLEGWGFAPREQALGRADFWDPALVRLNDGAFTTPTTAAITELADKYHVRYLVVDRKGAPASPRLGDYAQLVYDNGRVAVYTIRH